VTRIDICERISCRERQLRVEAHIQQEMERKSVVPQNGERGVDREEPRRGWKADPDYRGGPGTAANTALITHQSTPREEEEGKDQYGRERREAPRGPPRRPRGSTPTWPARTGPPEPGRSWAITAAHRPCRSRGHAGRTRSTTSSEREKEGETLSGSGYTACGGVSSRS